MMLFNIEELPELPPPYEIYEFQPATPAYFKVTDFKIGRMVITPRWPGAPPTKTIVGIRLYVAPETKPYYPPYWDLTPSRLVHQLAGMLTHKLERAMWLKIERDVPGPRAHFSVSWVQTKE